MKRFEICLDKCGKSLKASRRNRVLSPWFFWIIAAEFFDLSSPPMLTTLSSSIRRVFLHLKMDDRTWPSSQVSPSVPLDSVAFSNNEYSPAHRERRRRRRRHRSSHASVQFRLMLGSSRSQFILRGFLDAVLDLFVGRVTGHSCRTWTYAPWGGYFECAPWQVWRNRKQSAM